MRYRLSTLARHTGTPPQQVTTAQIAASVAAQHANSSRKLLRLYAGMFFAWMQEKGRREDNPAEDIRTPETRRTACVQSLPEAWREPVAAFLDHKAESCTTATVNGYGNTLAKMARRFGGSPQQVTTTQIHESVGERASAALQAKAVTACAQFFAWMQETGRREDNPAESFHRVRGHSANGVQSLPEAWREPVAAFLEYKRAGGCSEQTLSTRRYQLAHFAAHVDVSPQQVTTAQLIAALADCGAQWTRKGLRNCFVTFFRWLQFSELRTDNPAALLPNVRSARPRPKPCPDADVMAALEKATPIEVLIIRLAAECGLRRAEIACIHSRDVIADSYGRYSLIVHGKGGKQRTIPIAQDLGSTILTAHGYLFPGRWAGHVEPSYIGRHVSRLLPEGYSVHKLRHRFATVAYSDSHDMLAVSEALGHSSTEVTRHYVALPAESLRRLTDAAALQPAQIPTQATADQRQTLRTSASEQDGGQSRQAQPGTADSSEVIRAAMILAAALGEQVQAYNRRSFRIPAESFAARYNVPILVTGRRGDTLRAGALLLQRRGYVELNSAGDVGSISGNVTTGATQLRDAMDEYAQAWMDMQNE